MEEDYLYDNEGLSFDNFSIVVDSEEIFFPTTTVQFQTLLKVVVSVSCLLSIIGSTAIILSYAFFKEMRTLARHTLVCLSIADLLLNLSGFLGIVTKVSSLKADQFALHSLLGNWCRTQAAVLVFGTESSIMWTVGVAVYMFVLVVVQPKTQRWGLKLVVVLHFVCWGIPFVLTLWLLLDGYLWFDSAATPGFCAIVGQSTHDNVSATDEQPKLYPIIVGYEIWLYITFIVLPALYVTLSCHVRTKNQHLSSVLKVKATKQDLKLISVPLVFLILRIWSVLVDICVYYLPIVYSVGFRKSYASAVLILLEGIGDTAQGAVNGVIFCLFKPAIRAKIYKILTSIFCRNRSIYDVPVEESIQCDGDVDVDKDKDCAIDSEHNRPLLFVASNSYIDYKATN